MKSLHPRHPRTLARSRASMAFLWLLIPVLLGACADNSQAGQTLEFETAQAVDSPLYTALTKVSHEFEEQNPGVHINLKAGTDNYEARMKVRLAARNPPDIWATHGWSRDRYGRFLLPLDQEPWARYVNKNLDSAMKDPEGHIYALPVTMAASGLVVNTSVLQSVGTQAKDLQSWPDIWKSADKLKQAGITPFALSGTKTGAPGNVIDWLAPGALSSQELDALAKGSFDHGAYQRLLEVLATMRSNGWINPDYTSATDEDTAKSLAAGKAAMSLGPNGLITQAWKYNPDATLTYIPVPALSQTMAPYLVGGEDTAFGISKISKKADLAKKYPTFLAQPAIVTELSAAVGNPPGLTDAKPELGKLTLAFNTYIANNSTRIEPFFDRVYLPNGIWETVVSTADAVLSGQSSPDAAASQMASDFLTLYTSGKS